MQKVLVCLFALLASVATLAERAFAQELTARIRGFITDSSGSAVPGAEIKATNVDTQVSTKVPSDSDGSYQFLSLRPGTYDLTVAKPGFRVFTARRIMLTLNEIYDMPVKLEVGTLTEIVQVEANSVQVETTSTQLAWRLPAQAIVDAPLNGRNWTSLQQMAPGVVASSDRFGSNYATNGSQSQQNSYLINGGDAIDLPLNSPSIIPSPDAIAEFNLVASTINPEYGRNSGAILNAIYKSGTNGFHGVAFDFYRDTFLNDHNFYQVTKPVFHQNQFGGLVTGPIVKDHTFFMFSYQGTRARQPQAGGQVTVFSGDQRNGIFTDINAKGTSPFPLTGENGAVFPAGTAYGAIFPTGHIPAADFSSISKGLLSYVPLPNAPGNLYSFNPSTQNRQDQEIVKVDQSMSRDAIWGAVFLQSSPSFDTLPFTGSTLPGFGDQNQRHYKMIQADWAHTFNPTMLNDLRVSVLRFNYDAVEPVSIALPSSFGFTGINPQNAASAGLPYMSVTGYFNLGFSTNGPQPRIDSTYQLTDNFSKILGSHTIKIGFDGKRYDVLNPFYARNNGSFAFGGNGPNSTGSPGADFLLGIPDSYAQSSGGYLNERTYELYMYAQDTWRVKKNLTLNFGTGYQIDTPMVNKHFGDLAKNCFRPGEQSTVFPTAPVGLAFPGDPGCNSSGYSAHYLHFGPRFGFAYTPDAGWLSGSGGKFVIRGGFGVYYNRSEEELALQDLGAVPFSQTSNGIGDAGGNPSFANPFTDITTKQTIANKFPFVPATKGSKVDFSQFYPMSINVIDPNFTSPYALNYNLNIQRELAGAMILQIGYVGSQGRHLEMTWEGNPITPAGTAACAADSKCIANRLNQSFLYPTHSEYAPGNIFGGVGTQGTVGVSSYNSLQFSLKKSFSHGLLFSTTYTWSHALDDASGYENSYSRAAYPFNFRLNKGDSSYDARQRFTAFYSYELPHLDRFWHNAFVKYVLDGWSWNGITTLQTGFPVTLTDSSYRSLTCAINTVYYACPDSPNTVGTSIPTLNPRTSTAADQINTATNTKQLPYYWFNPNLFTHPAYGNLGTAGRNFIHVPGINNTDMGLYKKIAFSEQRYVQLRLEAYNVFNHTQFGTATSNVTGNANSANFGRILAAAGGRIVQLAAKIYF